MNLIDWRKEKILITGGTGLIGKNLTSRLKSMGLEVVSIGRTKGNNRYDLKDQQEVRKVFDYFQPKVVFHLAARVGGIYANVSQKSDFYLDNTLINTNVIGEVQKREIPFVFAMGTGCAYPKRLENQILFEETLLDGVPEITNDSYAYSKRNLLVHLKSCAENASLRYIYCIPANIYGPYDNFHPLFSHVVPGLIIKFLIARENKSPKVRIWGSGKAKRDFLYIDDLIDAIILLCDSYKKSDAVNVASGQLTSIEALGHIIKKITGYESEIDYDLDYPEGQKQRIFHTGKINSIGWEPRYSLEDGIAETVHWCLQNPLWWRNQDWFRLLES